MKLSIFTPSHETGYLGDTYESLKTQTHDDWEWIVLCNNGAHYLNSDPRVHVIRDETGNTNVGYLKRRACELCTGDVLVELDHDDELLPTCLEELETAFKAGADFVYSNTINHDVRSNQPVIWGSQFGWTSRPIEYKGLKCLEAVSAAPTPQSISRIWFAPNHVRAWDKEFYWKIGGHDAAMKISDDHDLTCRSYVHGKVVHIDKPLYFYRIHGENTWLKHTQEIQDTMWGVHDKYIYPMALKWANERNLRCIDLCGGIDKPDGYESLDAHNADIICDLDKPWPLATSSVGVIRAHDAIEHLWDPVHVMNEAWRVLAHGGFFLIQVPSSEGVGADCDPTHCSRWNWRSFRYYTETNMQRYIKHTGVKCRFQKIKVENRMLYDGVLYVLAHLVAVKQDGPRYYGELLI